MAVLRESGTDNLDNGVKRKGTDSSKKRKAGGGVSSFHRCVSRFPFTGDSFAFSRGRPCPRYSSVCRHESIVSID